MDLEKALLNLRESRPLFHSEADFQFALAWEMQKLYPEAKIRMEYAYPGPAGTLHIDIVVVIGEAWYPVELKYKKKKLRYQAPGAQGEAYDLKDDGAQDIGRYDFLKDVQRIELLSNLLPGFKNGFSILLTSDHLYWEDSGREGTVSDAFKLTEGLTKQGSMEWAAHTGPGTSKTREAAIVLKGQYQLKWKDYSYVTHSGAGKFRYLLLPAK